MSELNEKGTLDPKAEGAFRGTPEHKRYEAGTKFYKVGTREDQVPGARGNETFNSPWWVPEDEYKRMQLHADQLEKPTGEVARSRLAVKEEWNPSMSEVTEMTTKEPVWGWQGQARHQTEPNNVSYIGGAQQTYLPGLAADKEGMRSDYASITRYEASESTSHERQQHQSALLKEDVESRDAAKSPQTRNLGDRPGAEHQAYEAKQAGAVKPHEVKTRDLGERLNRNSGDGRPKQSEAPARARDQEKPAPAEQPMEKPARKEAEERITRSSSSGASLTSDDRSRMKDEMAEQSKGGPSQSRDKER